MMNIREQQIGNLLGEENRLQYDEEDEARIKKSAEDFTRATILMIEALGAFVNAAKAPVDENTADAMKGARYDVIYAWAAAQGVVSKIAHLMRIDGDEAYGRVIEAAAKGQEDAADLSGL